MTRILETIIILIAVVAAGTPSVAQTDTTFTYQGELKDNGNPATGLFDLDFSLWDAASAGNQIASTITLRDYSIVDGKFTVQLDFGAAAFENSARWLEITVEGFTLAPRQPITRAPYAIQTRGIVVDEHKNVGIGTSNPRGELEVADFTAGDAAAVGVAADDAAGGLAAFSSTYLLPHLADRVSLFSDAFEASGLDLRADGATSDIRFYTGGFADSNERMKISANGTVIVEGNLEGRDRVMGQTVTARDELILETGGSNANMTIRIEGFFDDTVFEFADQNGHGLDMLQVSAEFEDWKFKGDLSIGDFVSPAYDLHVDGTAGKPGGGSWSNSSDRRLKKNILKLDGALDSLLKLRGVTFEYKDPKSINELAGERIGMIAQEVEKVFPDWVDENGRSNKTVTYRGFEALAVEALRDLRSEKESQHAELDTLIASLRTQNAVQAEQISELKQVNVVLCGRLDSLEKLVEQFASTQQEKSK